MNLSDLSAKQLAMIADPAERKRLGKLTWTPQQCHSAACDKAEKELQKEIRQYLNLLGIWFDTDAMNRRRVGTCGAPDFQFPYKGRYVAWEVKVGRNNLDPDQVTARDGILRNGGEWRIVRSLLEAQEHLRELNTETSREAGK